jgi:S1-C subfamily serine protease
MNLLDWILILVVVMYGFVGYWQGLIAGAGGVIGLLFGGWLGFTIAPHIVGRSGSPAAQLMFLFIVIASASIGMAVCQYAGVQLRERLHWQPVRLLDNVGGSVLSAAAALIVAWALGVAVSVPSQFESARHMVTSSKIWTAINDAMPGDAVRFVKGLSDLAAKSGLQGDLWNSLWGPEPAIVPTGPVDPAILADPEIRRAEASVFKIRGANSCGRGVEGTGFLVAPGALMTNAHVVAGVNEPTVQIDGRSVQARVVYYNPDVDIAVLHFYGTGGTPLHLVDNGAANEKVAVIGYPEDGPLNVQAARIRAQIRLRSQNIYGKGPVLRDTFSLRGLIRPGNSGGPIVDGDGRVVGVVFAASVTDASTGYALTASQVAPYIKYAGPGPQDGQWPTVSTGDCAG